MAVNILDYMKVLWKRKWLIVFCFFFAAVLGYVVSRFIEPEYESEVVIVLQEEIAGKGIATELLAVSMFGLEERTATEIAIIKSDACLGKVIRDLRLNIDRRDIPRDETGHEIIGDIYTNDSVAYDDYKIKFIDDEGNYEVTVGDGRYLGSGSCGDMFRGGGVSFLVAPMELPTKGKSFEFKINDPESYVSYYAERKMHISLEGENILIINTRHYDAVKAKQVAERIVAEYLVQKQSYRRSVAKEISQLIKRRMNHIQRERNETENQLIRYQQENGVFYSEDMAPIIEPIMQLKNEATTAEVQRETLRLYMRKLESAGDADISYIDSMAIAGLIESDSSLVDLQRDIYEAESSLSNLRSVYTEKHPLVVEQNEKVRLLKSDLLNRTHSSLKDAIEGINERTVLLEARYNEYYQDLPPKQMEAARLARKIVELDTVYSALASEYEQRKVEEVTEDSKQRYIRVITDPVIPKRPVKPRKKWNVFVSAVFGGFFGAVIAFVLHAFDFTPLLIKVPGYMRVKALLARRRGILWK